MKREITEIVFKGSSYPDLVAMTEEELLEKIKYSKATGFIRLTFLKNVNEFKVGEEPLFKSRGTGYYDVSDISSFYHKGELNFCFREHEVVLYNYRGANQIKAVIVHHYKDRGVYEIEYKDPYGKQVTETVNSDKLYHL